jgi:hypothetical protein
VHKQTIRALNDWSNLRGQIELLHDVPAPSSTPVPFRCCALAPDFRPPARRVLKMGPLFLAVQAMSASGWIAAVVLLSILLFVLAGLAGVAQIWAELTDESQEE